MWRSFAGALAATALALAPAWAEDSYPVTVEHAFGETVIEGFPERIVTLSWMSQEAIIALGESPVAIQHQIWGGDENGYLPWIKDAYAERGEDLPPTINTTDGVPFEELLTYAPDLIFVPYSGYSQEEYERLSAIAPTVPFKDIPWRGDWQEIMETAGMVLRREDAAQALIADMRDLLQGYAEQYPIIEGKTFAFGGGLGVDGAGMNVYLPHDPRVLLLSDLGLVPAEALHELPADSYTTKISYENLDSIDADVFIAWYNDRETVDTLLANPLFARWRPVAEGHYVPLIDLSYAMALSAPSALSLPWVMDRFVPRLAETLEQETAQ
ncbi:iron-siderophore ABC transporter substrate-binding protein [Pelagibacterium sp. H642]|uniref:iron-siderophore ABC transporter substrate-binding protein n=1 Tax=Pelagibacterium sp. H642 TaxID=1881069 RepID=UPI0028154EF3|nr:iron-siderophore ABC transporter substrate-binding protein [Pelagibacterium sp. H642]WMT90731.1 iron-siderophore ABC transporter substrate-binding protein [Pelagibacterium sp. H642]